MYKPLPKQKQAYRFLSDKVTKEVYYGGAAGGGKTWLGCEFEMLCGWHLPGSRWFLGRNNLRDTRESALITWRKVADTHKFFEFDEHEHGIRFKNGSEVVFLDLTFYPYKDPHFERFGSREFTGGWIEEAGEVHSKALDVLRARVGRHRNDVYKLVPKILVTFNPKKNWLYSDVYTPWRAGTLPDYKKFIQALPGDNPFLSGDYMENLRNIKDKATRARLLDGIWEYDDDQNALCDFDALLDMFQNTFIQPDPADKWITADIALDGSDHLVIGVWYGLVLVEYRKIAKTGADDVIGLLETLKLKHRIPNSRIIYDSDGIGRFVGGFVKGARSFVNNARPEKPDNKPGSQPENFENLKAQCYYKLAELVNERAIWLRAITDQSEQEYTRVEFEQIKSYDPTTSDKKLRIQPKALTKLNIGRSPDVSDMCMMRMWPLVEPKKQGRRSGFG